MNQKIELLSSYIEESHSIVFLGGAGISVASGIPDFRSSNGLYNQVYSFPPSHILRYSFFLLNPFVFFDFYREKMDMRAARPNDAHTFLAHLEREGKLKMIVTQNIDGLHQKAGSHSVVELHGSIYDNYCMKCGKYYGADFVFNSRKLPSCICGGIIKPHVVLYEEALEEEVLERAIKSIEKADLLIVGGTSLSVSPANTLLSYFHGKHLVIINLEKTDFDKKADLVIHHKIEEVFKVLHKMGA